MSTTTPLTAMTLDQLYQTGDLPILGYTCFWQVRDVAIGHGDLFAALKAHNLQDFVPSVPTYRAALRAAIEEWLEAQGRKRTISTGSGKAKRERISVVNSEARPTMSFVVVAEDLDLTRLGLTTTTSLRFILWKEGVGAGSFTATTAASGGTDEVINEERQIVQEVGALYAKHRGLYDGGRIAELILKIVETCQPISLRPGGGVYFIPAQQKGRVDHLRELCKTIEQASGGEITLVLAPLPNLTEMRTEYGKIALNGITAEAVTMEKYLTENFVKKGAGTVKPETIAEQLRQFKALRTKAEAYAELLQIKAEGLIAATERLEKTARAVVVKGMVAAEVDDPFASAAD